MEEAAGGGDFKIPRVEPKTAWARILQRAGIEDLRIHDLRRSLGSWQVKTGASLAVVGKSLGHKTPQATVIYARLDPVRTSMERATSAMLTAAGMKGSAEVLPLRKGAGRCTANVSRKRSRSPITPM
jgi:integrase